VRVITSDTSMTGSVAPVPTTRRFWFVFLLLSCTSTVNRQPSAKSGRPTCAQPFAEGKCLEGTWPATWRDGRWDCKIVQDQMELDGVPVDRCASFVGTAEVVEHMRKNTRPTSRAR
jgi:hypothetical protein